MSLMGVDIGSSGCKVAVYSVDGMLISTESTTYSVTVPRPGEFELDSRQVLDAVYTAMRTVVKRASSDNRYLHDPLKAVSFGSFSEAMVPVSSHGEILGPSIFSHDQRGKYAVERFNKIGQKAFYIPISLGIPILIQNLSGIGSLLPISTRKYGNTSTGQTS